MILHPSLLYASHKGYIYRKGHQKTWATLKLALPVETAQMYLMSPDIQYGVPFVVLGECKAAQIDLDNHGKVIEWESVQCHAWKIMEALTKSGLIGHPVRSGGGHGINIWIIWDTPQNAAAVRLTLKQIVESVGYTVGAKGLCEDQVEVFPKQNIVAEGDTGSCAALPRYYLDPKTLDDELVNEIEWKCSEPVKQIDVPAAVAQAPSIKLSSKEIDNLIDYIKNEDLDYDTWWLIIMAIHEAGGDLAQAMAWSAKSSKHVAETLEKKWNSIGKSNSQRVTAKTLMMYAKQGGWDGPEAVVSAFPSIEVLTSDSKTEILKEYKRVPTKGRYLGYVISNIEQLMKCTLRDPDFPWIIFYDEFTQEIMLTHRKTLKIERLQDHHYINMREWFDVNKWEPVQTGTVREIVNATAYKRSVNVAKTWAKNQIWDGVDRYSDLLVNMGIEVTDYTKSVVKYWMSAHGARVLDPGHQCDSIIVLISHIQGIGKSKMLYTFSPKIEGINTYRDISVEQLLSDDKCARALRGCLTANLDEMRNFSKRESAEIKAAISRRYESYIPKYMEKRNEFGRQCVITATNNEVEYLNDATGNRRYYSLICTRINIGWIEENRDQLWAQGIYSFLTGGLEWQRAEQLAVNNLSMHEIEDVWEDVVQDYLKMSFCKFVTCSEILSNAINMPIHAQNQSSKNRIGRILRHMGANKIQIKIDGIPRSKFINPFYISEVES